MPVIPMFVGELPLERLPVWLTSYAGLVISDRQELIEKTTIEQLVRAFRKLTSVDPLDRSPDSASPVLEISLRFLEAANLAVRILEPSLLRIPEPVVLAATTPATNLDVAALERVASKGDVSHFFHDGQLPESVTRRIDEMRLRGNPVVTIAADTMRAALQDRNAPAVFAEHTRLGTEGINLFDATNAIATPSLFFGRTELLNQVGGALERGDAVLVTGVRKAGKSSFLHMLRQAFSVRPTAWIDLQRRSRDDRYWPDRVFAQILGAWDRWGKTTWDSAWPFSHDEKKIEKAAFIEEMELRWRHQKTLGSARNVLVVLDEVERMIPTDGNRDEADGFEQFTGAIRSLAQGSERCVTTLAADLRPEANRRNILPNQRTNPWFRFFVEVPLPPLTPPEVHQMVQRIAARMGVTEVEARFTAQLHAFTGGHAYMARLVAAAAWADRQSRDRLVLTDLYAGQQQLSKQATLQGFYEENLWIPLTDSERRALIDILSKSWWRNLFPREPADSEATASLRSMGLVDDHGITIEGFRAWLQSQSRRDLELAARRAAPS